MTTEEISKKLHEHADWLDSLRVSQDGWAKVLSRASEEVKDLAIAIDEGKIIPHISDHPKYRK